MSKSKPKSRKIRFKKFLIMQIKKLIIFLLVISGLFGILQLNNFGPWLDIPFSHPPRLSWTGDPRYSMTITWHTPLPTDTILKWGLTPSCDNSISKSKISMLHSVNLIGLQPNTTYYYKVGSSYPFLDYMLFTYSFKTAPNDTRPFKFAVYGDQQLDAFGITQHEQVIQGIIATNPDFVLCTGDLVENSGRLDQWDRLFYDLKFLASHKSYMPIIGNHEYKYHEIAALPYFYYFNLPNKEIYYSYNYSNAHFVSMFIGYSEGPFILGGQREWLEKDLRAASESSEIDWIFVSFHAPMFSSGGFGIRKELYVQFWDLFEKYDVDVILNGHDHIYERMYINPGIHTIVFGGGGGPLDVQIGKNPWTVTSALTYGFGLFSVDNKTLTYQAINTDGEVFDWFIWEK